MNLVWVKHKLVWGKGKPAHVSDQAGCPATQTSLGVGITALSAEVFSLVRNKSHPGFWVNLLHIKTKPARHLAGRVLHQVKPME